VRAFSDPTCRQGVAVVAGCPTPKYVIETEVTQCAKEPRRHVSEAAARLSPRALYVRSEGACIRAPLDPAAVYVGVGRAVAPTVFVAAKYSTTHPGLLLKTEYDPGG
jgi:hypothetical protein